MKIITFLMHQQTKRKKIMTNDDITILVVDDEEAIRGVIRRIIKQHEYTCFLASDGYEALAIMEENNIDVVITDVAMPKMDGIELTQRIKGRNDTTDVIIMTGFFKDLSYEHAIAIGASDFIQKPFDTEEFGIRLERVLRERRMTAELNQNLTQMTDVLNGVIDSLSSTVEARDPYTSGHQKRVATLAVCIAEQMALSKDQITSIRLAGLIHDLGKISIPAEILAKPSKLSDIEFSLIKTHPQVGYDIIKNINFSMPIAQVVYQHHERLDGSGYPRGLKGDDILLEAKVMTVADIVEAMSSHRPYRPSLGIDMALAEISRHKAVFFDPDVVEACLAIVNKGEFKFDV
jgi:putative two-component system response regulator